MTPSQLIDTASRHQVFLEGLKTQKVQDFNKVFDDIDTVTADLLAALHLDKLSDMKRTAFERMLEELRVANQELMDQRIDSYLKEIPAVAAYESEFEAKALKSVLTPEGRKGVVTPPAKLAHQEALKRPVQATGELLEPLVKDFGKRAVATVNAAVRIGYDQGKTVPQIIRAIRGTAPLKFKDGLTEVSRRHASTVVRTSMQHVAGTARQVTWEENDDLVIGVEWVSTLDGKTSVQCRSLDGRKFKLNEGPRPPIHPNCRSTTAPDMDPAFDFLDRGATRSALKGPVDANQTYHEWLLNQSPAFQDEVLGEERGKLLRDGGLTPQRFAELQLDKNFKPITLEKMKELEPLAFQRAGLVELFDLQAESSPGVLPGRPGQGTATGKVWDVADQLKTSLGRTPTRQEVLAEARKHGINDSTIGVQFGKWRKAVGEAVIGPIPLPPEPPKIVAKQVQALVEKVEAIPVPAFPKPEPIANKWNEIKKVLDETIATPTAVKVDATVETLRTYATLHPDGKGGINLDRISHLPTITGRVREALTNFKSATGQDFDLAKAANVAASKKTVHDLLEKVNAPSLSQKLNISSLATKSVKDKAQEAREFLDKVTSDHFKRSSITLNTLPSGGRAFYRDNDKSINMAPQNDTSIFVHEMAHHMEYQSMTETDGDSMAHVISFLQDRKGEEKYKGRSKNFKDEKVFDDEWVSRGGSVYTSRVYGGTDTVTEFADFNERIRATEVISTGAERLFNDPVEFYRKDPEHFEVTVRTLMDAW